MLTNLLPGLRDLRAPLSAGVVWLFAIWLAVEPGLPPDGQAEGVLGSVAALKDELSVVGKGAALAFVAYVLGSLAEAVTTGLYGKWSRFMWDRRYRERVEDINREPERFGAGQESYRREGWAPLPRPVLSDGQLEAVHELAQAEIRTARDTLVGRDSREPDQIPISYEPSDAVTGWWNFTGEGEMGRDEMMAADLARKTLGEFEQMRTRVLLELPELFSKVDRLQAEAQFRRAVGPALFGLGAVLAWRGPLWSAVLACLAGGVLLIQGRQRQRESNDALVEGLRNGKMASPAIERLRNDVAKAQQAQQQVPMRQS